MSFLKSPEACPCLSKLGVLTAPNVQKIYWDKGTGAHTDISVFGAELESIPEGAYTIGQVAVPAHTDAVPTSTVVLVQPLVEKDHFGDLIKPPTDYELLWRDRGSGGQQEGSFWRVEAPLGYVALGDVACNGYDPPSPQFTAKYACIRGDLLSEGVVNPVPVYTDRGSGAPMDVSIWNVEGKGLGGFFIAHTGFNKPTRQVFILPTKVSKEDQ